MSLHRWLHPHDLSPWEFTKLPAFLPQVKSQVGNTPFPPFHRTGPGLGGSQETQLGPYDLRRGRPWFCLVKHKNRWNKRIASRSDHQRTSSPGHLSKKNMLSLGPLDQLKWIFSYQIDHVMCRWEHAFITAFIRPQHKDGHGEDPGATILGFWQLVLCSWI